MSTVIGNIILSFIQQLTKPTSAGVIQIIFAIVSVLLSVRFIGDQNITYPNATPRITAQIDSGMRLEYDIIIIGSGSAGSVLAGRFTAVGLKVLLIEAGTDPQPCSEVPKMSFICMLKSHQDYVYYSNDKNTCNAQCADSKGRRCYIPRAKAIGGCPTMNIMYAIIYWYGLYDLWVQYFGCDGWGYTDIIKYFIKMEHYTTRFSDTDNLGYDGPMKISPYYYDPNVQMLNDSYSETIYKWVDNINKGNITGGFSLMYSTTFNGRRYSTGKAYLIPVKNAPNLTILHNALVVKILFDPTNTRAIGVQFKYNGKLYSVYVNANGKVISCAGVFGTPVILMLSGIGDRTSLQQKGITCIRHLPVIGKYLWDHFGIWIWWTFDKTSSSLLDLILEVAEYMGAQTGPISGVGTLSFVTFTIPNEYGISRIQTYYYYFPVNSLELPIICGLIGYDEPYLSMILEANKYRDVLFCLFSLLDPKSWGWVKLCSTDAEEALLDVEHIYNYLSHPDDVAALTEAMEFQLSLMNTTPFKRKNVERLDFGICQDTLPVNGKPVSCEYLKCYANWFGWSVFHPGGTCRMGANDTIAAVNALDFRVFGFENLYVCDASIVPTLPLSNLNLPIMAFAEKCFASFYP